MTDASTVPGNYAAFLPRGGEKLPYLATQDGRATLITLNGPP